MLIEYLITGATAFLWLWLLLHHPRVCAIVPPELTLDKIDPESLALLVPLAYVLGMVVDYASIQLTKVLTFFLKRLVWPLCKHISCARQSHYSKLKNALKPRKRREAPLSQHEVMLASSELGKQLEMRSSRDRVARGALLNVIIGTLVLSSYYTAKPKLQVSTCYILLGGLALSLLLFAMWYRFDRLTHRYRRKAGEAIKKGRP